MAATSARSKVGLLTLVLLLYSQSSAGPCGLEQTVGAAGIWLAIVGQVAMVLLFSLPQAAIAIELSRGVEENGGYTLWAERHLGPAWGSAAGVWGLVASSAYSASLVENIIAYMSLVTSALTPRWPSFGLVAGLTLLSVAVGCSPLRNASFSYLALTAFTIALFATLNGYAGVAMHVRSEPFVPSNISASTLVNMLLFNAPYFDSVAAYAGEARNPGRDIPLSIGIVAVLVTATDTVTLITTYFAGTLPASTWQGGTFAVIAMQLGGKSLRNAVIANAFMSNFQIVCANIQNTSYMLSGMAAHSLAPRWLYTQAGQQPVRAVLLCALITVLFSFVSFQASIAVQAVMYAGVVLVECAAYVAKRSDGGAAVEALGVTLLPVAFMLLGLYVQNRIILVAGLGGMLATLGLAYAAHAGRGEHVPAAEPFVVKRRRLESDAEGKE
jgi:amino acid transporter